MVSAFCLVMSAVCLMVSVVVSFCLMSCFISSSLFFFWRGGGLLFSLASSLLFLSSLLPSSLFRWGRKLKPWGVFYVNDGCLRECRVFLSPVVRWFSDLTIHMYCKCPKNSVGNSRSDMFNSEAGVIAGGYLADVTVC